MCTVELRYNELLYNKYPGITNAIFYPVVVKRMGKNPDMINTVSPLPWHFVLSGFHGTLLPISFIRFSYRGTEGYTHVGPCKS